MTLKEASERFCISMEKLIYYEENRLILYETLVDGVPDYTGDEIHKVSIIHVWLFFTHRRTTLIFQWMLHIRI